MAVLNRVMREGRRGAWLAEEGRKGERREAAGHKERGE
jgi:hypothetical protein